MNNIIKRVWNQNKMVAIEDLKGMTFQAESGGHTFQISGVDDAGNTVELSGSVAGVFLRPDNTDVAITVNITQQREISWSTFTPINASKIFIFPFGSEGRSSTSDE